MHSIANAQEEGLSYTERARGFATVTKVLQRPAVS